MLIGYEGKYTKSVRILQYCREIQRVCFEILKKCVKVKRKVHKSSENSQNLWNDVEVILWSSKNNAN